MQCQLARTDKLGYDLIFCWFCFSLKLEHAPTWNLHHWNRSSHSSSGFILEVLIYDSWRLTLGFVVRRRYPLLLSQKSSFSRFYCSDIFAEDPLFKDDFAWRSYWECGLEEVARCGAARAHDAHSEVWRGKDETRGHIENLLQTDGCGGESAPSCGLGSWSPHDRKVLDGEWVNFVSFWNK